MFFHVGTSGLNTNKIRGRGNILKTVLSSPSERVIDKPYSLSILTDLRTPRISYKDLCRAIPSAFLTVCVALFYSSWLKPICSAKNHTSPKGKSFSSQSSLWAQYVCSPATLPCSSFFTTFSDPWTKQLCLFCICILKHVQTLGLLFWYTKSPAQQWIFSFQLFTYN